MTVSEHNQSFDEEDERDHNDSVAHPLASRARRVHRLKAEIDEWVMGRGCKGDERHEKDRAVQAGARDFRHCTHPSTTSSAPSLNLNAVSS